jgi:hypothetical protein
VIIELSFGGPKIMKGEHNHQKSNKVYGFPIRVQTVSQWPRQSRVSKTSVKTSVFGESEIPTCPFFSLIFLRLDKHSLVQDVEQKTNENAGDGMTTATVHLLGRSDERSSRMQQPHRLLTLREHQDDHGDGRDRSCRFHLCKRGHPRRGAHQASHGESRQRKRHHRKGG